MPETIGLVARLDNMSSNAVAIFASPNTMAHSANVKLVVAMITLAHTYSLESRWNSSAPPDWLNGR